MVEGLNLIYADTNWQDIGVLTEYTLDMAYGRDENSFRLAMPIDRKLLDFGYYFYEEGGEIGGKVDAIKVDTANKQIIYSGRTWHGILASKVVSPAKGDAYRTLSGNPGDVMQALIDECGLSRLFYVATGSTIFLDDIYNYEVRYGNLLDVLFDMLHKNGLKMSLYRSRWTPKIEIWVSPYVDYSQDEEWSSSQRDFVAKESAVSTNHMICLGSGELENRHVIHLFSDGANILPWHNNTEVYNAQTGVVVGRYIDAVYMSESDLPEITEIEIGATYGVFPDTVWGVQGEQNPHWAQLTDLRFRFVPPYRDFHYVLDEHLKVFSGEDEVVVVYDYPNAATVENYIEQEVMPYRWDLNYGNYYTLKDGEFLPVEPIEQKRYVVLDSQPSDWATNVGNYYRLVDGTYQSVDKVTAIYYELLSSQPVDWDTNYGNYYRFMVDHYEAAAGFQNSGYRLIQNWEAAPLWPLNYGNFYTKTWDGTQWVYEALKGVSVDDYQTQTAQPTDWATNYGNYYQKKKDSQGYKAVEGVQKKSKAGQMYQVAPAWKKNRYYTKYTKTTAPLFSLTTEYYKPYSETIAPTWSAGVYYMKKEVTQSPTWQASTYYRFETIKMAPTWGKGYYTLYLDHYADLVANAIKNFEKLIARDEINITLKPDATYDIGDVVGAVDEVTGLSVWQPITKKIVKINRNQKIVKYEIGG